MDNIVTVMSLENGLQTEGEHDLRVIKGEKIILGYIKSSEMKQSSFHTPFLSGFLWVTEH